MTVNARTEEFQQLELFGKYALFTNGRIDRSTVPKGWYCYDFRGSDDDPGELCYIEESVAVNHISTGKPLPNAGFRIKDADGNVMIEGYTDEHGIARFTLGYGEYTYEEFSAPEGYLLDTTPHAFAITEEGQIIKAEMTNERIPTPEIPQTGDGSNLTLWLGLGGIALGALAACGILYFTRKKDEK